MNQRHAPALQVRRATANDLPRIHTMMQALGTLEGSALELTADPSRLRPAFNPLPPRYHVLLAELEGKTSGYLSYSLGHPLWKDRSQLRVDDLFIIQAMRGRGLGQALMRHAEAEAAHHGCTQLRWSVETGNQRAIALCRRLGARMHSQGICTLDIDTTAAA